MSCTEWQSRVDDYVDGELAPDEAQAFRAHAAHCPDCASVALAQTEAKNAIRRAGQRYEPSSELRARVLAGMRASTQRRGVTVLEPTRPKSLSWPQWPLAAAAVILLAAGLFFFDGRNQRSNSLEELADLHVTNLASSTPVEVVSSDRHTVKPWFQGRIPFTFDLPDLQGTPFILIGGRVTYFHQEPGAHLIFAYQRHMISAFVFRDTPQLSIAKTSFSDRATSFNLQTWTHDGLRYVLVSDVNAAALQQLASLLQRH